jgi:NAD(P)-dependent dehydrogenase (short-subunit alcohol dehydrogenase family)
VVLSPMASSAPKRIYITGVSSGIGRALALHYAAPGVTLGLLARREERLREVERECADKGARVFRYPLDVTDRPGMLAAAAHFSAAGGGADLVIANAGTSSSGHARQAYYDIEAMSRVLEVNLIGVVNTLVPFLKDALRNGHPIHLAAVGSVAGFRALPNGGYSASKAGLKVMMDTWRLVFGPRGIRFTTICPGFTESEMTARDAFAPSRMLPASKAASLIAAALARGKKTFVFPARYRPVTLVLPWIPDALIRLGTRRKMKD